MLKLGSKGKAIGTPIACPACRHPNPGINIWCDRCRTPLDWNRPSVTTVSAPPAPMPVVAPERPDPPLINAIASGQDTPTRVPFARRKRAFTLPRLTIPAVAWPRLRTPAFTIPRPTVPRVPRIALVVAAILAVLLIVPLAYMLLPAGRAAVDKQAATGRLASTSGAKAADTAQAAAIPGVEAKTHLTYNSTGKCDANTPCLTVVRETMGKDAAAVVFSTASSAARQCAGYVYRNGDGWHFLSAVCGLPEQLSPLVGHDATVRIAGNCANVREGPSLKAHVVACLNDGTTVHIDGGPTYADSRLWWHQNRGWMAQDFLAGP
jgi:hypothetical protein